MRFIDAQLTKKICVFTLPIQTPAYKNVRFDQLCNNPSHKHRKKGYFIAQLRLIYETWSTVQNLVLTISHTSGPSLKAPIVFLCSFARHELEKG